MSDTQSLKIVIARLEEEIKQLQSKIKELSASAKLESDYQESQLRFRTVFESSRLGNKILDSDLKILQVNPALVAMLGYDSKEDLIGHQILQYAPMTVMIAGGNCRSNYGRSLPLHLVWKRILSGKMVVSFGARSPLFYF